MLFEKKVLQMYKSIAHNRCDDTGTAYYFTPADFDGLQCTPFAFRAAAGHTLQGYFYNYSDFIPDRIVVFDHGFGGGHRAYMREIDLLCRHGFRVFSYDHTGCMESGGSDPNGMAQSLCDLNDCLCALKADKRNENCTYSVMGHSWGGFSTLQIASVHKDITHAVVISGFISVDALVGSLYGGILKPWKKAIMALETDCNPAFVQYDAIRSLQHTNANILLIYSENDQLVSKKAHFDVLHKALSDKPNIRFVLEKNKSHNPNYTTEAVRYLAQFSAQRAKFIKTNPTDTQKKTFTESFDWKKMTEQDAQVWAEIFKTLDS